jgi:hypothetical protein
MAPRLRIAALERLLARGKSNGTANAADAPCSPRSTPLHHHHHHYHHRHAATTTTPRAPAAKKKQQQRPPHQHQPRPPGFGPRDDARSFFWGTLGLAALAYCAGAAPWSLHLVFLAFFFVALPLRVVAFWRQRWQFFLIDYCYAAACAAAGFLLFAPDDPRIEAIVYALTEGPLAAALAAWQCRWQLGSLEHTVSTHLHLLPGLAVVAHRYAAPSGVRGWRAIGKHLSETAREAAVALVAAAAGARAPPPGPRPPPAERSWSPWSKGTMMTTTPITTPIFRLFRPPEGDLPHPPQVPQPLVVWLVLAPLGFYVAWQVAYFLVVQVACRGLILRGGYDTSYRCLARRAAKNNNVWNRMVRKGPPLRRCLAYGGLQLAFTVLSVVLLAAPAYWLGPRVGALVQVAKVAVPLWYGARYQCEFGAPKKAFDAGVRWARAQQQEEQQTKGGQQEGAAAQEEADDQAAAAAPPVGRAGSYLVMESVSAGVLMAAGLGSGDGARGAVAGSGDDDSDEGEGGATSKLSAGGGGLEPVDERRRQQQGSVGGRGGGGGGGGEAVVARAWLRRHQSGDLSGGGGRSGSASGARS